MMWALFGLFSVVAAASESSSSVAVEQISRPTLATNLTHGVLRGTAASALVIKPADGVAAGMFDPPFGSTFDANSSAQIAPQSGVDWRGRLLELTNSERARFGRRPLCYNAKLNAASQRQSDSGVFEHTWAHINQQGYKWTSLGQNIARGYPSVDSVFSAWYNEVPPNDGHRKNILNPGFTQMGAGWNTGTNYWTQNFGASNSEPCS